MNRVTIISLAGQAFHIQEEGEIALRNWLSNARESLKNDPDCEEILNDFEQAIADRFSSAHPGPREVIQIELVKEALDALGTVESAQEPSDKSHTESEHETEPAQKIPDDDWRSRKLYRITGEEAMLAGVCTGLAAYFRVDVVIVRLLMVLLTIITSGVMILIYIAMIFIVPEAKTPDDRALAHGHGLSAQELMDRARESAGPALSGAGSLLSKTTIVIGKILYYTALTIAWMILSTGILWAAMVAVTDPVPMLMFTSAGIVTKIAWIATVTWLIAAPLFLLATVLNVINRSGNTKRRSSVGAVIAIYVATWTTALIGTAALPWAAESQVRDDIRNGALTISFDNQVACVGDPNPSNRAEFEQRCDHYTWEDDHDYDDLDD